MRAKCRSVANGIPGLNESSLSGPEMELCKRLCGHTTHARYASFFCARDSSSAHVSISVEFRVQRARNVWQGATLWNSSSCAPCTHSCYNPVCHHVIVLARQRVAFCSAAKVASTSIREYFLSVADGDVVAPARARFPVHQANWTRLAFAPLSLRKRLVSGVDAPHQGRRWAQVVFVRNVVERFVSGYLDKIVHDCKTDFWGQDRSLVKSYYEQQHNFSCANHKSFPQFVTFMEQVGERNFEGHFAAQTRVCDLRYPFTDIVLVDSQLDLTLKELGERLGVKPYLPSGGTGRKHSTDSGKRLQRFLRGRHGLILSVLRLFEQDCAVLPGMCLSIGLF